MLGNSQLPSHDQIKKMRDIGTIKETLVQLINASSELNDELDTILGAKETIKSDFIRPILESQSRNTDGLMNIIDKTFTIANAMSSKVRTLDVEQSRVRNTLRLLDQIKDLQHCLTGVQHALKSKQYTQACDFIKRFLQTDIDTIQRVYNSIHVQISDDDTFGVCPIDGLWSAQKKLVGELETQFDAVVKNRDADAMTKIFKLFPLIGAGEVGLSKYCGYFSSMLKDNIHHVLQRANGNLGGTVYVECLSLLFENIATTIDRQEQMIESLYGVGSMLFFIRLLQMEADSQSCLLLNSLLDVRQVERKVNMIQKMGGGDVEPRELDAILGELALVCHKAGLFDRFIKTRVEEEHKKIKGSTETNKSGIDTEKLKSPVVTKYTEKIQTCVTYFAILCDFFLQKSIVKALSIDSVMPDSLTTSCVDDVFFILKGCIQRGLSTGDPDCLCVMINSISKYFEVEYMDVLLQRLSSLFKQEDTQLKSITPTLNNIEKSVVYMQRLCEEVEKEIPYSFAHVNPLAHEQIKACLGVCNDYAGKCDIVLKTWLDNYFKQIMKPRVRQLISSLCLEAKFILSEEEYTIWEVNDQFKAKLNGQFVKLVQPFETTLTERNLKHLIGLAIESFSKEWEVKILQFKFNHLGALKLDKEIRASITYFLNYATHAREYFQRLSQLALVLNVEEVSDIMEYWGSKSGSIRWRLSVSDIKKILGLRTDFTPSSIAQLQL